VRRACKDSLCALRTGAHCRRYGRALPAPIVNAVERVVEKVVVQQDLQCLQNLEEASKLISATAARLQEFSSNQKIFVTFDSYPAVDPFPTLDEMERAMILAAYRRANRMPVEAARLLGIGKTPLYRKLREMR
jgi:transcriptional regulator of acetoin/glycerol metabolism